MEYQEKLLIGRLRAGEESAFEYLFRKFYPSLKSYATNIVCDNEAAHELVEELFVKLWNTKKYLHIETSIKSYLFKSIHNKSLNYLEHQNTENNYKKNIRQEFLKNHVYTDSNEYPFTQMVSKEIEVVLEQSIGNLPEQCKEVFKLSRFENLTYAEIATKLGISVNTVKTQIKRALKKLREDLKDFLP